ncbi:unnamed protein product [Symbiodinium sp. CCMP2592]|nr:unnamed protein product [Symbiodinium sp. CCMP2592]CAE7529914.1 unnamed protein product [Symbiodinium sp. CCMP2592]CAE7719018.1 unnamed protein product [Symbiodinium sp. CCMP2592]
MAPKRSCIPKYDKEGLKKSLSEYVKAKGTKDAFVLGPYEKLARSKAANGLGLLQLSMLISVFLDHVPAAELHISFLKDVMLGLVSSYPALSGSLSPGLWANWMVERVLTLLNHVRRLSCSAVRLQEACSKLAREQREELTALVARVTKTSRPGSQSMGSKPKPEPASSSLSPAKRCLKPQPSAESALSVDSSGFPRLFAQDAKEMDEQSMAEQSLGIDQPEVKTPMKKKATKPMKSIAKPMKTNAGPKKKRKNFAFKKPASYYKSLSKEQRAKLRPGGCSKCRWSICTPSCFV